MLVRGNTMERRRKIEAFLKGKKYIIAPVTIDPSDWKFNTDYMKAVKDGDVEKATKIGADYVNYVKEITQYFMELSERNLGRQIKHIFLIHMNQINAAYLDKILEGYQQSGWQFVSIDEALEDPVYSQKDNYVGQWGTTWLQMLYGD
jgi:peptidoglycan-N-acetylglucosamine deacetylase